MASEVTTYEKDSKQIIRREVSNNTEFAEALSDAVKILGGWTAESAVQAQNAVECFESNGFDVKSMTVSTPDGDGEVKLRGVWNVTFSRVKLITNKRVEYYVKAVFRPTVRCIVRALGHAIPDNNIYGDKASAYVSHISKNMTAKFIAKCDEANHLDYAVSMFRLTKGTQSQADLMLDIMAHSKDIKGEIVPSKVHEYLSEGSDDSDPVLALLG